MLVNKFPIYLHHAGTLNVINIYREDREEAIGIPVGYSVDNHGFSDKPGGHGGLDSWVCSYIISSSHFILRLQL